MPPHRQVRLFMELLLIANKLDKIITAAPEWNVSKGLSVCYFLIVHSTSFVTMIDCNFRPISTAMLCCSTVK